MNSRAARVRRLVPAPAPPPGCQTDPAAVCPRATSSRERTRQAARPVGGTQQRPIEAGSKLVARLPLTAARPRCWPRPVAAVIRRKQGQIPPSHGALRKPPGRLSPVRRDRVPTNKKGVLDQVDSAAPAASNRGR